MASIPVPWVISILALQAAAMVLAQPRLPRGARLLLAGGLGNLALVAGIVGLRLGHGLAALGPVQPHLAVLTAPALWLGFRALTLQDGWPDRRDLVRHGGLILAAQAVIALPLPWSADLVVAALGVLYAVLLAGLLRLGDDGFVQVAAAAMRPVRIALAAALAFQVMAVAADAAIVLAALSAGNPGAMRLLTGAWGVAAAAVTLGALVAIPLAAGPRRAPAAAGARPATPDADVLARIDALMTGDRLFKDPGLTVARLGRRAGLPARTVSAAINAATGENVSRYVNGHRIRHAAQLLRTTDLPVTEVMLEAGFLSKSSFNAEFRRILGTTPSAHRRAARA